MGNNKFKKEQADLHNKARRVAHVERVRIAQDKIDNPEKYKATRSQRQAKRKAMAFASMAMTISPNAFNNRILRQITCK